MSRAHLSFACSLGFVFLAGCTIALKDVPFKVPAGAPAGSANAAASADGIDGRVGWGRLSMFAIPTVPIFVVDDSKPGPTNTRAQIANREVMRQVRRALVHAGYEVKDAEPGAGRRLECHIEKFRFSNYTWLIPIVPTWGSARITASVRGVGGEALWSQTFEGGGFTLLFVDGYSGAANQAMKKVLNAMVPAFQTPEFKAAISGS